jgi:hypothetical protein
VVGFNRAVAVLEHRGPAAALDALDETDVPTYLVLATRAEALRAGRDEEAADGPSPSPEAPPKGTTSGASWPVRVVPPRRR